MAAPGTPFKPDYFSQAITTGVTDVVTPPIVVVQAQWITFQVIAAAGSTLAFTITVQATNKATPPVGFWVSRDDAAASIDWTNTTTTLALTSGSKSLITPVILLSYAYVRLLIGSAGGTGAGTLTVLPFTQSSSC